MLFHSFEYVLFLWTVFMVFWGLRGRRTLRHGFLLAASYFFYGQADWRFVSLLVVSSIVDFFCGARVQSARDQGATGRAWLFVSLAVNLGVLGFFKYFDFFVDGFGQLAGSLLPEGFDTQRLHLDVVLPVGISFYTFQTLSYTFDIYRGKMRPITSLLDFALYVSFFPQLVAGPIVRAIDFLPQLAAEPQLNDLRISSGLFQILRGLAKKLLIADLLGAHLVDPVFASPETLATAGAPLLLLATWAYALQLYGDFAGYSDIAIGSARLLGFELPKNFDAPYKSRNLEEFWSRWHISMSSWFMDYVYIGLGGSRVSFPRYARNVLVAWGLVGLWHGAAFTFVLWGLYHGLLLVALRGFRRRFLGGGELPDRWPLRVLSILLTFHAVAFSMILFRTPDLDSFASALRGFTHLGAGWPSLSLPLAVLMILGYASHLMPDTWQSSLERSFEKIPGLLQGILLAVAIALLFALHPPGLAPFIYFQF